MGEGKINRDAWAQLVAALVESETRGKKATFARMVGVDPRTITRWLASEVDVSEQSVREVARRLGRKPIDMLVDVGYYQANEINGPPPAPGKPDPALQKILDAKVSAEYRQRMLKRLESIRAAQRDREADEVAFWIEQAGG